MYQPTDLLNQTQVADLLGVSRQQVKKYIDSGRIKSVAVGTMRYVKRMHAKKPKAKKPGPKTAEK